MRESIRQRKIIEHYEKDGWYVIKLIQTNKNGITDLEICKDGIAIFIEAKVPGERPSPLQLFRHEELRQKGFKVIVATSVSECVAQLGF